MRSYESATLWKTPATRSVLSASVTPSSKPKWVVRGGALCVAPGAGEGDGEGAEAGAAGRSRAGEAENARWNERHVREAAERRSGRAAAVAMLQPSASSPCKTLWLSLSLLSLDRRWVGLAHEVAATEFLQLLPIQACNRCLSFRGGPASQGRRPRPVGP